VRILTRPLPSHQIALGFLPRSARRRGERDVRKNRQPVRPRSPSTKLVGRTRRNGGAGGDARYAIGIGDRTGDHGQGLHAVIAVLLCALFYLLSRSCEYGFAALTMNKELGLSSYVFGLGAGAFFWGYFILEVPSNLILDRVGGRQRHTRG